MWRWQGDALRGILEQALEERVLILERLDTAPQIVNLGLQQGWLGGSLYDTLTTDGSPWAERMWEQLRRFNR